MFKLLLTLILCSIFIIPEAKAQDSLPDFSLESFGINRTRISWTNQFGEGLMQVNVQVSYDSLRNFGTVFEPLSPSLPDNGFMDNKEYTGKVYYRIFYVLTSGAYFFTQSKSPESIPESEDEVGKSGKEPYRERTFTVKNMQNVLARLKASEFERFRDSIKNNTKDTLVFVGSNEMVIKTYQHPSTDLFNGYIGLNQEGFVEIKLPDAKLKKYKLVFKNDNGGHLFTINKVNDTDVILDKTNFLHAGWFYFELYQDEKVIEKSKIYLQSDF